MRLLVCRVLAISTFCLFAVVSAPDAFAQKCLHPGFEVELVARVPEIEHPSVVTCDDRGNLFVGEDPMDMRGPTTKEFDRIIYFTFDANGKIARRTVFAENLAAVFGLVWYNDTLYVMHAPHYTMLKDTDGDGVADVRRDLADGFGPAAGVFGFNDHIVTGTRLGLDGFVYVSVGDKGVPKATGSDGSTISLEGGGVIRMRPDGTQLEVVSSGTRNHLDVAMDSLDNIFTYDNTDDGLGWWTRFTHHIPTGYYGYPYDYHPHADRHLPRASEHGGGSPVGAACYREAAWPAKYRDAAFHCEWGKRKVQVFYPKPNGATFDATMEDFLVPDDGSEFRPQDLCFSPDGRHMYVADWQFGGWVKPDVVGRVYRVTYVGNDVEAEPPRATDDAPLADQIRSLAHPAYSERLRAQHRLSELGPAAIDPLRELLTDASAAPRAKVHAIWALNGAFESTPGLDPSAGWLAALQDVSAEVRAQAARAWGMRLARRVPSVVTVSQKLFRETPDKSVPAHQSAVVKALARALSDEAATVRLQSAVALGRIADISTTDALFASLDDPDQFARFAKIQALRSIGDWTHAARHATADSSSLAMPTILALTEQYDPAAVAALIETVKHARADGAAAKAVEALGEVHRTADAYEKGWWGTQPAKGKPARPKRHEWSETAAVLAALRDALRHPSADVRLAAVRAEQQVRDPAALAIVRQMAGDDPDEQVRTEVLRILAESKDVESLPTLAAIAADNSRGEAIRQQAVATIQAIGSDQAADTLNRLAVSDATPAGVLRSSLEALAALKVSAGSSAAERRLAHADPAVRAQAARTLAALAPDKAAALLTPLLTDAESSVRSAVVAALAAAEARDAVPEMIRLTADPAVRSEAIIALASLADRRALAAYLEGLVDKNPAVRSAAATALSQLKSAIGDDLKLLNERNELSVDARRELGSLFASPAPIMRWQLIGAWSQDKDAPPFDLNAAPDTDKPLKVGDRELRWQTVTTGDPDGKFEPGRHVKPDSNVWAMAYAAVEASADTPITWQLGSDDQARLWINGQPLYEFGGNRGWSANSGKGSGTLRAGVNHIYFQTGNTGGPWQFSLSIGGPDPQYAFLYQDVPAGLNIESFRQHAAAHAGDARRGEQLFFATEGVGCFKCHSVGDRGDAKIGPNLLGVGAKYPRHELIRSVLEPSNRIAQGFEMTVIVTDEGKVFRGIVRSETDDAVELVDSNAKPWTIEKSSIDDRAKSNLSAMPNGLEKGLTLTDFADIIAYLESQKQAVDTAAEAKK